MVERKEKKNNNNIFYVILSIITLLCLIFLFITTCYVSNRDGFKKEIKIVQNGTTIDSMEIKSLNINPGQKVNYQVVLNSTASGTYEVSMDFVEKKDGGLKRFIIVSIVDGEKNILEKNLSDVFNNGKITFTCNIEAYKSYVIDVEYLMPKDVNNEAMGTTANFDINFEIDLVL